MPSRFRPTQKPKLMDPIKSERLRRVIRAHNDVQHQYIPNKMEDKSELETSLYKQRFKDNVERELIKLIRVKVPRGHFELEEKGTVDEKGTVSEALVYIIQERVRNPNPDPEKGESQYYAHCSTKMGIYKKPTAIVKRDLLQNPVSSKVTGAKAMFYIPFSEKNVKQVLEEFNYECSKGFALAIATNNSADSWHGAQKYTVYNLEEFIHGKFEDVLGANQGGFLKDKLGRITEKGVEKYIMDKADKREKAEREFNEFKEKQKQRQTKGKK